MKPWRPCSLLAIFFGLSFVVSARAIDFDTQVMPVLTRSGCNAGACHGAAVGRGGFRLSLLGSDPSADYAAIVHELEGRRVHRSDPKQSLLLRKPTGDLDHGGDVALPEGSPGYRLILGWLMEDVPRAASRRLVDFRVTPQRWFMPSDDATFSIRCDARFEGEAWEDVTHLATFTVVDPEAVALNHDQASGQVKRPGQHLILVRYLQHVVPVLVVRPFHEQAATAKQVRQLQHPQQQSPQQSLQQSLQQSRRPPSNFIDQEINALLDELCITPSEAVDDWVYLRRVTLDLTGRLPTRDEVDSFSTSEAPDKRERLVDRLLASRAFVDYWTLAYAKLLRVHSLPNEPESLEAYSQWLRHSVAIGLPWNQLTNQLMLATGDSHRIGAANFGRMVGDSRAHAELVGSALLGIRIGCANCHDHPLDRWTQDDYHGLAAIFARLDRGRNVQYLAHGEVTNPRTRQPAHRRIPGHRFIRDDEDAVKTLAEWIENPTHGKLARAHVNRLWSAMLGRGLIEPADDLRETNPASHPRLLDRLTENLIQHEYDLRQSLRLIVASQAYTRASSPTADAFYAQVRTKPLPPEVLADAIADMTGVPHRFLNREPGTRAVEITDTRASAPVLEILGRCNRSDNCLDMAESRAGLATQLHYLNGELINQRLADPQGRLQRSIMAGDSTAEIIDEFYRLALGRPPSPDETQVWDKEFFGVSVEQRRMKLEDLLWSVLSSQQFQLNH